MPPLKVLIYEPYPMGQGGGNLRTLSYILKFLDRTRFEPILVAPEDGEVLGRFRQRGVEVAIVPPPPSIHRFAGQVLKDRFLLRLRSTVDLVRYNVRLARLMRARRVDVVYCNGIRSVLLAGIGARFARVPALWYVKGALENPFLDRLGFFIANRILFFCEANRDDRYPALVRWNRDKIRILRIGLDAAPIVRAESADATAIRAELEIRHDRVNAMVLAQLYRPKGHHVLLQGLRRIVDACPAFMLYIVGDHILPQFVPYRAELEAIIERDGLRDHVRFTGWRSDSLELLRQMDLLIHPSLAEGFGRAVLEAMALGRAVVASAVGGLREIIRDGENGFLVPPGNVDALVDRVNRLARDPALRERFGREAKREVFANYLIEDKIRELETVWETMARAS